MVAMEAPSIHCFMVNLELFSLSGGDSSRGGELGQSDRPRVSSLAVIGEIMRGIQQVQKDQQALETVGSFSCRTKGLEISNIL